MSEITVTATINAIRGLTETFGPTGTVCLFLAAVVAWVYRRDVLRSRAHAFEVLTRSDGRQDHLLQLVERNATANEALAATITRLADTMRDSEATRARSVELLVSALKDRRA